MLDLIDLSAEREAAAALRLQRLTGAREQFDGWTGDRWHMTGTETSGWHMTRLNDGSAFRAGGKLAAVRAHEKNVAAFAGQRVTTATPRMDIVTANDRARRKVNQRTRTQLSELAARLHAMRLSKDEAKEILAGRAALARADVTEITCR